MSKQHPEWAKPPYPQIPPSRFDRVLVKIIEWLRRRS